MDVTPGTADLVVLLGDARVAGFGSLERDARLFGEAGPDFAGEAGLTGRANGAFLPSDGGGEETVWGPGRRRVVSWRVSLSRAVFWQNRRTERQLDT